MLELLCAFRALCVRINSGFNARSQDAENRRVSAVHVSGESGILNRIRMPRRNPSHINARIASAHLCVFCVLLRSNLLRFNAVDRKDAETRRVSGRHVSGESAILIRSGCLTGIPSQSCYEIGSAHLCGLCALCVRITSVLTQRFAKTQRTARVLSVT